MIGGRHFDAARNHFHTFFALDAVIVMSFHLQQTFAAEDKRTGAVNGRPFGVFVFRGIAVVNDRVLRIFHCVDHDFIRGINLDGRSIRRSNGAAVHHQNDFRIFRCLDGQAAVQAAGEPVDPALRDRHFPGELVQIELQNIAPVFRRLQVKIAVLRDQFFGGQINDLLIAFLRAALFLVLLFRAGPLARLIGLGGRPVLGLIELILRRRLRGGGNGTGTALCRLRPYCRTACGGGEDRQAQQSDDQFFTDKCMSHMNTPFCKWVGECFLPLTPTVYGRMLKRTLKKRFNLRIYKLFIIWHHFSKSYSQNRFFMV